MSSQTEKWTFWLTFAVFFLTMVAVLVAVGYATVHLIRETPTRSELTSVKTELKTEIESVKTELKSEIGSVKTELKSEMQLMEARIINALQTEVHTTKDSINSRLNDHVSNLHASKH